MCHARLRSQAENGERLVCEGCGRWYPIFQGIPMMLPEHEMNLKGGKLNSMFTNPPGIAIRKSRHLRWYYDRPRFAGGMEEGEWGNFGYKDVHGRVLDIGAGERRAIEDLGEVENYVSIDIIPRDRPTVVADAHYLPFREGVFDAVIARAVLEHVEDEQKVVSEAVRVLKPGGLFLFSAPFIYPIHDAVDHHRFTIYSIRALAERHGLEIMRITSSGGYFGVLADHVHHGLRMIRDFIDRRFEKKPIVGRVVRGFADLSGMLIY
ncbi:MAG: methyltransferase domain-containing protein, partial [Thermoplasmata archaeon]|nr:methyltransferase domain-containing protein [Thermoplasmata archaeon]